jgi:hypothetical protein
VWRHVGRNGADEEDIVLNRPLRLGIGHRALVLDFLTPVGFGLRVAGLITLLVLSYSGVSIV